MNTRMIPSRTGPTVRRVTSSVSSTKVAVTAQSAGVKGSTPVQRVTSTAPFSTM